MEKSNDKAKKVNKLNINEMKIEYKGKIYSFDDAINENIIVPQEKECIIITSDSDEEPLIDEDSRVIVNNASLIVGGCKIKLNSNDCIKFNDYYIKGKKYITLDTKHKVWAILGGQKVFLTKKIIIDPDNGKIVGGYLCPKYGKSKELLFSCNINDNNIGIKDGCGSCFVFTKDGKVDHISITSSPEKPAVIQHNGKEIFIPKEGFERIDITKIDDTFFPENDKKSSGVNFYLHPEIHHFIKTDIDGKYANAGILNLPLSVFPNEEKALKNDAAFDYTIYNNGFTLIKHHYDNVIYRIEKIDNSTYQVINKYILPEDEEYKGNTLSSCTLRDEGLLDFINDMNKGQNDNKDVNNQSVDTNELSKCYSNKKNIEK